MTGFEPAASCSQSRDQVHTSLENKEVTTGSPIACTAACTKHPENENSDTKNNEEPGTDSVNGDMETGRLLGKISRLTPDQRKLLLDLLND